jgi:hypothetical protein
MRSAIIIHAMTDHTRNSRFQELLTHLKRLLRPDPEPPEDPYAYVGAPKKPRLPRRSASAAAEIEP